MPGDPLQRRLLNFIRAYAMEHGSPIALDDLLAAFERSCDSADFDKALATLHRLDRIILEDRDDGVAQVRSEGTNPDGTAASCRFCGLARGPLAMWRQAEQCEKRPRGGPCEPRWIDHRGRDKIVRFDAREVTDYLHTIEQARSVVIHRSVWAPLAADPEVSVPIPQGALFALVRYYRDSPRCVGGRCLGGAIEVRGRPPRMGPHRQDRPT